LVRAACLAVLLTGCGGAVIEDEVIPEDECARFEPPNCAASGIPRCSSYRLSWDGPLYCRIMCYELWGSYTRECATGYVCAEWPRYDLNVGGAACFHEDDF
jgi:hypothetical protein